MSNEERPKEEDVNDAENNTIRSVESFLNHFQGSILKEGEEGVDVQELKEFMDENGRIIWEHYRGLKRAGFQTGHAFVLTRQFHHLFWGIRLSHDIEHGHSS